MSPCILARGRLIRLQRAYKARFVLRVRSITVLQALVRRFLERTKYASAIAAALNLTRTHARVESLRLRHDERNYRRSAALRIEQWWRRVLRIRELKALRLKLAEMPWEYRLLYAKFIKVRADTDILKSQFKIIQA
jgi:hypothetical protein